MAPELFPKGIAAGADLVCLDLEDAVQAADKEAARANAIELIAARADGIARLVVRINHPSTPEGRRDVEALADVGRSDDHPLSVMVPKVDNTADLREAREALDGGAATPSVFAMIETAKGVSNVREIAAEDGLRGLVFGGLDLSIDLGAAMEWESLLFARSSLVIAARASGVLAIDMPYLFLDDEAGLRDEAGRVWKLGFTGKAAIHPRQVPIIRDAFSHTAEDVARARQIVGIAAGVESGVFIVRGEMIDHPAIEAAHRIVAWAERRGG